MSALTTKLSLYLAGGGSTGSYGADETADIDKINQNFVLIDNFAATAAVSSDGTTGITFPGAITSRTDGSNQSTRVARTGNIVTLTIALLIGTTDIAAGDSFMQLPTGFRPVASTDFLLNVFNPAFTPYGIAHCYVDTPGAVRLGRMMTGGTAPITTDNSVLGATVSFPGA